MSRAKAVEAPTKNPSYSEYWSNNLCVIPETNAIPNFAWAQIYRENWKPTDEILLEWDLGDLDYGLVTGQCSNIIAIDLDYVTETQQELAIKLLGKTPCAKKGEKGITLFFRYNGEKNTNWVKDGEIKAELLSTGRKTTIPPSRHRKTNKPYIWIGQPLLDCYDKLPTLPANYIEILDGIFSISRPIEVEYQRSDYDFKPSYNEAVAALNCCDATNPDRNGYWIPISLAFKNEVGEAGFSDWDNWCAGGGKQYKKSQQRAVWRSLNSYSVTYGTLIHYAKQRGYKPPQRERTEITKKTTVEEWEKYTLAQTLQAVEASSELPEFYTNAPYHIKEVCEWIVSTSLYPQPMITLGSVLAFFGFVMGRDFEVNSLRTNLYVANVAYSADGKEHVNRCIRGLLTELQLQDLISYGWTSDTAIINDLTKNQGRTFYLTDELQSALRSIKNRSTNSAEGRAVDTLLQAYTGVEVRTVTKADLKTNPTMIVKKPLVTLCGYTTPHMFETCLGTTEVFSGFVGRLTAFRGNKFIPEENDNFDGKAWEKIPENIKEIIHGILVNREKVYNPDATFAYITKTIPMSDDCKALVKEYRSQIAAKRNEMRADNNQLEVVMGRAAEVMLKYAMIASRGKEILSEHINWAISLVEYNLSIMFVVAEGFADTKFEAKKIKVMQYIEKRGGAVEKSNFTNGCKIFETSKERNDVLEDLREAGKLELFEITGEGQKPKTGYRLVK